MNNAYTIHPASYRDPAGFIFYHNNQLYRQVSQLFRTDFDLLMTSGAYDAFVKKEWLVAHERLDQNLTGDPDWYTTLKPSLIPFISYPWEWSFGMLKDAALLTLKLARQALDFGLVLKDASPFNIQWYKGKPVFIDTLSFARYNPSEPWIAYRQFCETLLSPLLLMHYSQQPLQALQLGFANGVPLQVTSRLLPWRSRFNIPVYLHIHLHGKIAGRHPGTTDKSTSASFSKQKMINLLGNLETLVEKLQLKSRQSTWLNYYDEAGTRDNYLENKKVIIGDWLEELTEVHTVADLGANEGGFSILAAKLGKQVLAADLDPFCIDRLYHRIRAEKIGNLQPLVMDLAMPSPAAGADNLEYASFSNRCQTGLLLALALIHHLCIGRNLAPATVARFFSGLGEWLILEYVPPEDEKVQLLLSQKTRSYPDYNEDVLLAAFAVYFDLEKKKPVGNSGRQLWLFRNKQV